MYILLVHWFRSYCCVRSICLHDMTLIVDRTIVASASNRNWFTTRSGLRQGNVKFLTASVIVADVWDFRTLSDTECLRFPWCVLELPSLLSGHRVGNEPSEPSMTAFRSLARSRQSILLAHSPSRAEQRPHPARSYGVEVARSARLVEYQGGVYSRFNAETSV